MNDLFSLPRTDAAEESWQEAIYALPTHDTEFYAVLRSLPLSRAQVIEIEAAVNKYVSDNEKSAFFAGYAAGMSAVNVVVMN